MPKRIIDGEALWRSKKLKNVPVEIRAEYANLLPLAEANGSFDADPYRIWADVYSFNRPDVTPEDVNKILEHFEKAGMIVLWTENGNRWGHFVGSKKPGRLPPSKHLDRYKDLPPEPPDHEELLGSPEKESKKFEPDRPDELKSVQKTDTPLAAAAAALGQRTPVFYPGESRINPEASGIIPDESGSLRDNPGLIRESPGDSGISPGGVPKGFGISPEGFGMGGASDESGINPTSQPPLNGQKLSNESEDDMTLQKKLESICFRTVGQAEPWENLWSDVKVLARAFGQRNVISAFEIWAALQDDKVLKPIASFLKVAPFMLRNDGNAKLAEVTAEDVNNLVRRLVEVGRYEVLWSADQKVSLYKALQRYAADDVVSAFRTFYSNLTSEYDLRFASQTFIMHLPQLMQEVEKKKEQEEIMKKIERQSEIEAKQLLEKLKKEEEEEELFGADNLID